MLPLLILWVWWSNERGEGALMPTEVGCVVGSSQVRGEGEGIPDEGLEGRDGEGEEGEARPFSFSSAPPVPSSPGAEPWE